MTLAVMAAVFISFRFPFPSSNWSTGIRFKLIIIRGWVVLIFTKNRKLIFAYFERSA